MSPLLIKLRLSSSLRAGQVARGSETFDLFCQRFQVRVERLFVINMNERKSASVNVFDVAFDSVVTNEKEGKEK